MISVDQIYLLQQKVESAVQKIEQLKSENDALRTKCSELTNALSEKTELLSSFTADEQKIETGIINALNRLDSVENNLLDASTKSTQTTSTQAAPAGTAQANAQPVQVTVNVQTAPAPQEPLQQNDGAAAQNDDGIEESDSLFGSDTAFETEDDETQVGDIF